MDERGTITAASGASHTDGLDLVIVGGGPAGLSAAVEASKRGWRYVVLERAKIASTVRSFPPGKKVYAEPRSIPSHSELDVAEDRDKDEFLERIDETGRQYDLNIKEETDVARVRKVGDDAFEVDTKGGKNHFPANAS